MHVGLIEWLGCTVCDMDGTIAVSCSASNSAERWGLRAMRAGASDSAIMLAWQELRSLAHARSELENEAAAIVRSAPMMCAAIHN